MPTEGFTATFTGIDDEPVPMPRAETLAARRARLRRVTEEALRNLVQQETQMPRRYNRGDDVRMRLTNSVVTLDSRPVFVNNTDGFEAETTDLITSERKFVDANDEERLDIAARPVGWINPTLTSGGDAKYLTRAPYRNYKQGLSRDNTVVRDPSGASRHGDWSFELQNLGRTILREFPELDQVLTDIKRERILSGAVSPKVCFKGTKHQNVQTVFIGTKPVAYYRDKSFVFPDQDYYDTYYELLREYGNAA